MPSTEQLLTAALERHRQGARTEAQALYEQVLAREPGNVDALQLFGALMHQNQQHEQAVDLIGQAIRLGAVTAPIYANLGEAYRMLQRFSEAIASYEQAIQLQPGFAVAHNGLGTAYQERGRHLDALACFDRAIALEAHYANAHYNRGRTLLSLGDFQRGWLEYEWRWKRDEFTRPHLDQPEWDGSPLASRTLLVRAEQGLGDTLQFIRYVQLLAQSGASIVTEVQPQLVPLLSQSGFTNLVAQGNSLPRFDVHVSLLSLPRHLQTRLETIPQGVPYLAADPQLVSHWREKLSAMASFKIALHWQGPVNSPVRGRWFPLAQVEPIARIPGVQMIGLQKHAGREQIAALGGRFQVRDFPEIDERHGPFMDTAAIMRAVDLVITSDSATAHLAGTLGVPVWVALPYSADWRWLQRRSDTPWYPSMRLFRQARAGDWPSVFEVMAAQLPGLMRSQSL